MGRSNTRLLLGFLLLRFNWCLAVGGGGAEEGDGVFPVVVSTWPFREAVRAAWEVVTAGGASAGGSAADAVVAGCSVCKVLRCDGTGTGQKVASSGQVLVPAAAFELIDHHGAALLHGSSTSPPSACSGLPAATEPCHHGLSISF